MACPDPEIAPMKVADAIPYTGSFSTTPAWILPQPQFQAPRLRVRSRPDHVMILVSLDQILKILSV